VDGQDFWALSDRERTAVRRKFGMSFQEGALFDSMTVFDNVAFPLRRSGRPPAEVRRRVRECLDMVHLPNVEGKRPSELSGGMRRRVGFARAIAHQPEILLFDEPNTGLDPIMTDVIDEVILELKERLDPTIATITHHMESARKIGDRVALLHGGRLLFEAPPDEFLRSDHPSVRQFVEGRADGPLTVEFEREKTSAVSEGP
jgi:phospholipid/cholesterol/gamma-HCH transport system ATP-binding protein